VRGQGLGWDTIWVAGVKHLLAGFDTPEYADKARCLD